jgi:lysozyme
MNPIPRVLDLSHHQIIPTDLQEARGEGIVAIIHKLTEGTSFVDSKAQARHYLAQQADMRFGLYHFLRPGSMKEQAEFFINTAKSLGICDDDTLFAADHEDQSVTGQQLKEFLDRVEDLTGHSPVVYSGHVLKEQLAGSGYRPKRRLWLAQYCPPPPELPEGVDAFWLWQFSESGDVGGISPVDVNHFEGDAETFLAGWAGRHEPRPPRPTPVPVMVELIASATAPVELHITANENVEVIVGGRA